MKRLAGFFPGPLSKISVKKHRPFSHSGFLQKFRTSFITIHLLLALAVLVNFSGLFVTLINPDATLYATLPKTMMLSHDYLDLVREGKDWLDKPHFPFWITVLFYWLFGIHDWAYKLPAILFTMMASYYTYLFAKELYSKNIALWSAIIFLTAEHIIISNNDVRAEPYMTGLIIASTYYFYMSYKRSWFRQIVWGSLFTAMAMMTKGWFVLVPIFTSLWGGFAFKSQWNKIVNRRWLIAGVLILVFILPELWALWYQFDSHPEKIVFGRTDISGIRFFFWDSQFGRFSNTGPIKGNGQPLFFLHTILWAFFPWSLLLYTAVYRRLFKRKDSYTAEYFTWCGAIATFLLFSFSRFQLPYYTNIIFPFTSIIVSHFVWSTSEEASKKTIRLLQITCVVLMVLAVIFLQSVFKPAWSPLWIVAAIVILYLAIKVRGRTSWSNLQNILLTTVVATVLMNCYLNLSFYPALLKYQADSEAAFFINDHYTHQPVINCTEHPFDMQFYLHDTLIIKKVETIDSTNATGHQLLFARREDIKKLPFPYIFIKSFKGFAVSRLNFLFLKANTRGSQLQEYWLVRI